VDNKLSTAVGTVIGLVGSFVVAGLLASAPSLTTNVNVALTLMVIVVVAAAVGGRAAGALSAVAAALSYDFFQTEPVHSLRIGSRNDIETAILLLVAGLIVGQIGARAQLLGVAVDSGRSEIRRLHRLADLAARGVPASEVIDAAVSELTDLLSLRSCRFEAKPFVGTFERLERSGVVNRPRALITWTRAGRHGLELPHEGAELLVLHRGAEVGRFVLVPEPGEGASLEQRVVAVALADQVGAVLGGEPPAGSGLEDARPAGP
jgi:K+-sensing histidine kinase KdpD